MPKVPYPNLRLSVGILVAIGLVSAILFCLAAMVPVTPRLPHFEMIQYLPVYSDVRDQSKQDRFLPMDVAVKNRSKDYVVYEGELYLKIQETRRALIATEFVRRFEWSQERLDQLVSDHPELEVYTK